MFDIISRTRDQYDGGLVALAGVQCLFGCFVTISLLKLAAARKGRSHVVWIVLDAAAGGCCIWATHFIAMLAYEPGVTVGYGLALTLVSFALAIGVTGVGIAVAVQSTALKYAISGGCVVGGGIEFVHFTGMAALDVPVVLSWNYPLVGVSIILGVVFAAAAFVVALRSHTTSMTLAGSLLLTIAILFQHFAAMTAVTILPVPSVSVDLMALPPASLGLLIAVSATGILAMCLVTAIGDQNSRRKSFEKHGQLDAALENISQGLCMFDAQGRVVLFNQRYVQMRELKAPSLKNTTILQIAEARKAAGQFAGDPKQFASELIAAMKSGEVTSKIIETTYGRIIRITHHPIAAGGWVTTREDITKWREAEKRAAMQYERFNVAMSHMVQGLIMFDADGGLIVSNARYAEMFALPEELTRAGATLDAIRNYRNDKGSGRVSRREEIDADGRVIFINELADGRVIAQRKQFLADGGSLSTHEDITARCMAEEKMSHMARHDALTGLPNRLKFREDLEQYLAETARGAQFAVLYLDLDRFKDVNDSFGHAAGDELLRQVTKRLKDVVRGGDIIARLGGDEFAVVQRIKEPNDSARLAERMIAAVSAPYEIGGNDLEIGTSVGIALAPEDGSSSDDLIHNADMALYHTKGEGRGAYNFFAPAMIAKMRSRQTMEVELRRALQDNQFDLYYQPLVATHDRSILCFEALLRWRRADGILVPPAEFIPFAEEIGLIAPLGEWVLRRACLEAMQWPDHIKVAVNVSAVQFKTTDLADVVQRALEFSGLPATRLEIEITESVLINDREKALAVLTELRAKGISIALDDFGTGYSSLGYLRQFSFDKIKIDRSFVSEMVENSTAAAIVRAATCMAKSLGISTTAEGVETEDQFRQIGVEGCTEVQGYLISRPMPSSAIPSLLGVRRSQAA